MKNKLLKILALMSVGMVMMGVFYVLNINRNTVFKFQFGKGIAFAQTHDGQYYDIARTPKSECQEWWNDVGHTQYYSLDTWSNNARWDWYCSKWDADNDQWVPYGGSYDACSYNMPDHSSYYHNGCTAYGKLSIPNQAPSITSVSDSPDPIVAGNPITFTVNWTDPNAGDQTKIHICKTNAISGQTCSGGSWCDTSSWSTTSPTNCSYTTQAADAGTKNYYAFVCDDDNACSSSVSGTFTVEAQTHDGQYYDIARTPKSECQEWWNDVGHTQYYSLDTWSNNARWDWWCTKWDADNDQWVPYGGSYDACSYNMPDHSSDYHNGCTAYGKLSIPNQPPNVWGWAWSDNIGWVSFSSENMAVPTEYGVSINANNGKLSGYAWSDHVGWVSFNQTDLSGCPVPPCKAEVDLKTGYVSGWAKALVDGGGWSGWLRLRDSNHGVWIDAEPDPAEFMSYSWSDLNIGWLSFNCRNQDRCGVSNYKVMTSLAFEPEVPTPNVSNPKDSFDDPCSQSRVPTLTWNTNATKPYDYEIEIDDDPNFGSPNVNNLVSSTSNTFWMPTCSYCCNASPYNTINWGGQTYYWHVRARNSGGEWSNWASDTFITKTHCYPSPDFTCNGINCETANISEDDVVILSDNSSYYNGRDHCKWSLPSGAAVIAGNPNQDCAVQVKFAVGPGQSIGLTVFDSVPYDCSSTGQVNVSVALSLPEWKEIKPW